MIVDQSNQEKIQAFFFEGAMHGWAGGNIGHPLPVANQAPGMNGWMEVCYENQRRYPSYQFFDRWGINPETNRPSGQMTITHSGITVWAMWVGGGHYNNDVYTFMQKVLNETYRSQLFFGGRGYRELREGNLLYTNAHQGNFARFHGREQIEYMEANGAKRLAGSHEYFGGMLV